MAKTETTTTAKPPFRRSGRRRLWVFVFLIVAAGAVYAAYSRPWEEKPALVEAETVGRGPVTQVLAVNGRVIPANQVGVRSSVPARALEVAVAEGDEVAMGQALVMLDTAEAQARVDQAQAMLDAGLVRQQQAQANADRAQALGENASRSAREDATLAFTEAESEVRRLRAALRQAQSELEQYTIVAPFDGVILERNVDRGQLVDSQSELFVVADITRLLVETEVDELYSSRIEQGLKVFLRPVGETVARHGTVTFAAPRVDTQTGGRIVRIAFDDPAELPVGLTVNANIVVAEFENVMSIPRSAVVTEDTTSAVLVVENGVVVERPVVFSDWPADRVVVTEGIEEGDVVVLDPASVTVGQAVGIQ